MHKTQETLSNVVIHNKYARHNKAEGRRETWKEIVDRYVRMMLAKYGEANDVLMFDSEAEYDRNAFSHMGANILWNAEYLYAKRVLMSMRAAQFSGEAIEKNHSRIYNCAYLPIDHPAAFSEAMFLLLGGTGVGYSVQNTHIDQLPEVNKGSGKDVKFLVGDSIEGWADSIKAIMYWGLGRRRNKPRFDFSDIRPKGSRLVTAGGKAPGPGPLRVCLAKIESIFEGKENGSKLTSLECHDILCHIADAVLAGGIRRAAMIALFSADDMSMITCKSGNWWESNPQRGRANNSAVLLRHRVTKEFFLDLWKRIEDSNAGEPGVYFSNDLNWGTNPCCEIALRPFQFCNLTEINADGCDSQHELDQRARVASFFGTLQAGFTDFHYLRSVWRATTEKDALIGVGMTGICSGDVLSLDLTQAALIAKNENERVAKIIGINPAARTTTVKPSGTTSCVVGSSSGIHAWHSKFYVRNIQCRVGDELYNYFTTYHPLLIKTMDYDSNSAVIGIPQKAPEGAILRESENAIQMLDRVFNFYDNWVKPGHRSGSNTNNVSATVYIDKKRVYGPDFDLNLSYSRTTGNPEPDEWEAVGEILWDNRHKFNGMSCLPYDGGSYKDAPFTEISEERYNELLPLLDGIDLSLIREENDNTTLAQEAACAGGACEI